jgi:hypothetical protein
MMAAKRSRVIPKDPVKEVEFLAAWLNDMRAAGRIGIDVKVTTGEEAGAGFGAGPVVGLAADVLAIGLNARRVDLVEALEILEGASNG